MVRCQFPYRQAAIKVVARPVEKIGKSIRKQYDASLEDLALMTRMSKAAAEAWKLRRAS
jgi:hypothetical protein